MSRQRLLEPSELIESFFDLLTGTGATSEHWLRFRDRLFERRTEFTQGLERNLNEQQRIEFLSLFLIMLAHFAFSNPERQAAFFAMAESMGVHLLTTSYYSPVPVVSALTDEVWQQPLDRGWDPNERAQLDLLQLLSAWSDEMRHTPVRAQDATQGTYYVDNLAFNFQDAVVYHAMIRHFRPKRVLEVGGGFSTMVAARAALLNGDTVVDCVEPFPMEALSRGLPGLTRLIATPVQSVPPEEFEALGENDILFIDGTHVSKIGSDVNYLYLRVLPVLKPGVIVHIHDIFLPEEYPRSWVQDLRLFWNEQYLLQAFLMFNSAFEVLLANHLVASKHRHELLRAFPFLHAVGGCSFWLRRKA